MPRQHRLIQLPLVGRVLLCLLAGVYLVYMVALGRFLYTAVFVPADTIVVDPVATSSTVSIQYWTATSLSSATGVDSLNSAASDLTQANADTNPSSATRQEGQPP